MGKIRVLSVDDAVVIRRMVTDVLAEDPSLEVVGSAANGGIALRKIPQVKPDVVILDVEMPEVDGLATLAAIRRDWPRLPVIMFSSYTERGAETTIEALALGASDYITKPSNVGGVVPARQRVRDDLIPKIKALCGRTAESWASGPVHPRPRVPTPLSGPRIPGRREARPPEIVAFGLSTGGPNALATVLPQLPADFPLPVVIVQHMPPLFTKLLAKRLDSQCHLRVREGQAGSVLQAGTIWIAPGDHHMVLERAGSAVLIRTDQSPPENSCRPAADVLFRSIAAVYGGTALAFVLTGMGQDGLRGSEAIYQAGGHVVVQDEESSVVWGMPGYVAQAGLADRVLPLDQIAGEMMRRVSVPAKVAGRE